MEKFERAIVGAFTKQNQVISDPQKVKQAEQAGDIHRYLSREVADLMFKLDFGPQWKELAEGPTLVEETVYYDDDGERYVMHLVTEEMQNRLEGVPA